MSRILHIDGSDQAQLRDLIQSPHTPPTVAKRCNIILASAASDTSVAEIARHLKTSPAIVRHWQNQFTKHGLEGLMDAHRAGAPRRIDERTRTTILDLHNDGLNTRHIAARTGASQSSISRIIREMCDTPLHHPAPFPTTENLNEQLVVELFQSLTDENPISRFLNRIKKETKSDYGVLLILSNNQKRPSLVLSEENSLDGSSEYQETHYTKEIMNNLPEGKVITISDIYDKNDLHKTDLYKDFLSKYGVGHILGIDIGTVRGISGKFRLSRLEASEDFGPRERAICQGLVPYLRAALDIFVQRIDMETEKEALSLTVSGMSVGSVMVDSDGHIIEANPPALAILEQKDGVFAAAGKITLHDPNQSKQLHRLIRHNAEASIDRTTAGITRAMLVARQSGKDSISLLVRPATGSSSHQLSIRPTALIHLVDPTPPRMTMMNALIELFDLTPAEANVALSLANGQSINDTARLNSTSKNTVRAQVRSIFSKMGINRQSQLIRTTLISVALLSIKQ